MLTIFQIRRTDFDLDLDWLHRITAGMACVGSVWLTGISLFSSILLIGIVGVVIAFGKTACSWAGLSGVGIGVGFMIGAGVLALSGQLLLVIGTPASLVHWTIIAGMALCAIFRQKALPVTHFVPHSTTDKDVLFCLAIALMLLAVRHPWLLFFALPVLALERYGHNAALRRSYLTLLLFIAGIGLLLSKHFRPDFWWYYYQGNDSQYFEALGWSLAEWGIFEHPGNLGGSIAEYHWLSYAFFGQLTRLAFLDSWDALMKVGPLLIPFATAGVMVAGVKKIDRSLFMLVLLGSLGLPNYAVDSFTFSIPIAFTMIYIVQRICAEKVKSPVVEVSFLLLISTILIFAKVSTAIVVFAFLAIWSLLTYRSSGFRRHLALLVLGFAGIFWYVLLFRHQPAGRTDWEISISDASQRLIARLANQQFALQVLTCIVVVTLIGLNKWKSTKWGSAFAAALVTTSTSLLIEVFVVGPSMQFWVLPSFYILIYLAISAARNKLCKPPTIGPPHFWIIVAVLLGFLIARLWNYLLNGANQVLNLNRVINDAQWDIVQSNGLIFVSVTVSLALAIALRRKPHLYLFGIVPLISLVIGFVIETNRQQYSSLNVHRFGAYVAENASGGNSAPFESSDLRLVASHIRESTSSSTVLASNNFCCEGRDWWPYARTTTGDIDRKNFGHLEQTWTGGANYLLPALTQRRFLMQGLAFQVVFFTNTPTREQIQRMTLSLEFANSPNRQAASDLKAYGVSGYVVNLSLTEHRDWSEFAIERFQSGDFVYLELR